ncbi:MAG: glycosyltransferase family 39 protein [Chloroflexi bacterium]|nr:glycosyltransferase family 39 protein [Chloroflexota bacterium]
MKRIVWRCLLAWLGLAVLLLAACALRLYRLDAVDLSGDEAFAAVYWTLPPFSAEWLNVVRTEPGPGVMALYWGWTRLAGDSAFALRMLPLLANVLGLALIVTLARRLSRDWRTAALAGFLWALHPFLLWHAQDARQYSLVAFLSALNFYLLLRAYHRPTRQAWLIYGAAQTLTLYIYYLDALWLAAQAAYLFLTPSASGESRRARKNALLTWALLGVALLPLAAQTFTVLFVSGYRATARSADFGGLLTQILPALFIGAREWPLWAGAGLALALAGLLWWTLRSTPENGRLLLIWLGAPLLLFFVLSTQASLFRARYLIGLVPPLLLLLALTAQAQRRWLAAALVTTFTLAAGAGLYAYFFVDAPKGADWRGLTAYLQARAGAHDTVIFAYSDPAINYYYHGSVTFIPAGTPDIPALMDDLLAAYDSIFLLAGETTGAAQAYLQANAQTIPGITRHGVTQYRAWQVRPREIQVPLEVDFGGVARLRGYTLQAGVGGGATLLLYWEALAQTADEHSVLLHLQPAADELVVRDHGVANAQISTRAWQTGVVYRDAIALDVPAGDYALYVGMYGGEAGTLLGPGRLPLGDFVLNSGQEDG